MTPRLKKIYEDNEAMVWFIGILSALLLWVSSIETHADGEAREDRILKLQDQKYASLSERLDRQGAMLQKILDILIRGK